MFLPRKSELCHVCCLCQIVVNKIMKAYYDKFFIVELHLFYTMVPAAQDMIINCLQELNHENVIRQLKWKHFLKVLAHLVNENLFRMLCLNCHHFHKSIYFLHSYTLCKLFYIIAGITKLYVPCISCAFAQCSFGCGSTARAQHTK